MKNLILIAFIALSFSSCTAQKIEQKPLYKVVGTVGQPISGQAIIDTHTSKDFEVALDSLEVEKEYVFWLEITDRAASKTPKAIVVHSSLTTSQVQKDQAAIAKELEKRKILKP